MIYPVDSVNQPLNNWVQKLGGVSYKVWDPSTMFYEDANLALNVDFFCQLKVCHCWTFQWREQTVWPVGASFIPQWRLWSDSDLVKNWWLKYKGMKYSSLQHFHKIKSLVMSINRGYYMAVRRYEISLRVLKNISRVSAANKWNIFSTREEKFRISKWPCNVLFIT